MKVFVSWSGELSKQIAQTLKKWLPCLIQSLEIFYSPEDIEKGENWDSKISQELSNCNFGIICLTSENTTAPWIHFEAGALAKALDAKVSTLMVNINPSDIKGPLSKYQATRLDKDDFAQLIISINKSLEAPLSDNVLLTLLDALWPNLNSEFEEAINAYASAAPELAKKESVNAPLEEILQLLRKQNVLLTNPEELLPPPYFEYLQKNFLSGTRRTESIIPTLLRCLDSIVNLMEHNSDFNPKTLSAVHFEEIFFIIESNIHRTYNGRLRERYIDQLHDIHMHYEFVMTQVEELSKL